MYSRKKNSASSTDDHIQEKLGAKLREVYADVINEPVPDRFLQLLDALEKSSTKKDQADLKGA